MSADRPGEPPAPPCPATGTGEPAGHGHAATLSVMPIDHYLVLGVRPDARPPEIRAAYLRLMRENHPDLQPGDPAAADTARRVNAAYRVVGDASRRGRYDHARPGRRAAFAGSPDRAELLRAAAQARRASAHRRRDYRQAFRSACLRVGVATVGFGTALLLTIA